MDQTEAEKAAFREKLAYWRENGGLAVRYQGGADFWHNKTIRSEQQKIVARGKANGQELVPAASVHGP
jgi:hypothetical protein